MFTIDFTKPFLYKDIIYFNQGNLAANNILRCKLATGGDETLEGYIATVTFKTLSHAEINELVNIVDAKNCIVDIKFPSNALEVGVNELEVILTKGEGADKVVTPSPVIKYEVWQCLTTGNGIQGDSNYPILINLISDVNNAVRIANNASATADASLKQTAKMLDVVNDNIAKANEAIDNTNSAKDEALNAVEEVNSAKDNLISEVNAAKNTMIEDINSSKESMLSDISATKQNVITDTNKAIEKMNNDFEVLTASQQQDAEVILARDGEESLNARLERDLAKGKIIYETVEDSYISTDDTLDSYIQNIEIKGNTIQNPNDLSDIKSVGDKVGDEELYRIPIVCTGENLLNEKEILKDKYVDKSNGKILTSNSYNCSPFIRIESNKHIFINKLFGSSALVICFYDNSKNFISYIDQLSVSGKPFLAPNNAKYLVYTMDKEWNNNMVSYGAQATPYEPYKEHKITILSPVQLEKVGDVTDRIIEKNGVWGVEKNISQEVLDGSRVRTPIWRELDNSVGCLIRYKDSKPQPMRSVSVICDKIRSEQYNNIFDQDIEGISSYNAKDYDFIARITKHRLNGRTTTQFFEDEKPLVKYITDNSQFIPLPHAQQVKLKTFANKTNISFLTEVEGTIKADVAKSISASVNSNTQEISKINNRILDLEGLKESQEMSYETDKGYLVCKETKNGTVKDLKVKGKSLVNICKKRRLTVIGNGSDLVSDIGSLAYPIENEIDFTVIVKVPSDLPSNKCFLRGYDRNGSMKVGLFTGDELYQNRGKILVKKVTNQLNFETPTINIRLFADRTASEGDSFSLDDVIVLIGDHTQNPPKEYFEGIASVGTGVDKIEVSSYTTTILNEQSIDEDWGLGSFEGGASGQVYNSSKAVNIEGIKFLYPYAIYNNKITSCKFISFYDKNRELIGSRVNNYYNSSLHLKIKVPNNAVYVRLMSDTGVGQYVNTRYIATIKPINNISEIVDIKSDKKPLLYFDTTTNTWKPIPKLNGYWEEGKFIWGDTVEDGKLIIKTNCTLLKDVDGWGVSSQDETTITFVKGSNYLKQARGNMICNTFSYVQELSNQPPNSLCFDGWGLYLKVNKSDLTTLDSNGLTQLFVDKKAVVIYEILEEKVFEVNPLFLESYENETMISLSTGVINAPIEFKIASYITNLVLLNQNRIKELENEIYKSQDIQDIMILENDLRLMDIEFALEDIVPIKLNLRSDDMFRGVTEFEFLKGRILSGSHTDDYLEKCINKYKKAGRLTSEEYDILYDMIYPPVYDILAEK